MPGFEKTYEQLPCPTCPNEGSMLSDLRTWTLLLEICTQRGGCVRAASVEGERLIKEGRSKQKIDDLMLVDWSY